jgi:hypothetical protein
MSHVVSYLIDNGVSKKIWEPLVEMCTAEEIGGLISRPGKCITVHRSRLKQMRRRKQVEKAWNSVYPSQYVN